ncbi:hypothetical protein [Nocardiopsis algeriensis]|uniref:Tetratricopeptide (TPR) repeat protein n=1 Tax=Nocardiopsis algeriensis TaxID=1478215 RepID=A0A841IWY3_9ACTN|nr:hypothetical protein [Nocardiopsis algeriensis]MBB6121786.1 tetratricopeptide (TPR) repeat protein [Nocardiopsis algeriensis]
MRLTRVTTAELDRLEFHAVRSGEHAKVAAQLLELANQVDAGSEISRAELFVRAGEQWEFTQEYERACAAYQRAIDDGAATVVDARALRAGALLHLDEIGQAYAEFERLEADEPSSLQTYLHVAESLYAHDDLAGAERWATEGARLFLDQVGDPYVDDLLQELLRIRFRIRADLGLAEDALDRCTDTD